MKAKKQGLATFGLIFITFLAAIQYVFLQNVPDTVSTFAFITVTNVIGLVILGIAQVKKLFTLKRKTLLKGILFAVELTGFNSFLLMGSRNLDAVIISSVVSLYFVFITPLLLILRKKVNFFSGIATVIAIIALLLMFGADTDALFSSVDVVYLVLADIFFAAYVVSVSILGENEDSTQLTLSQMVFSATFAFAGWMIQNYVAGRSLSLPTETSFWISAVFIGVFIRAVYGLVQISCQKYVPALKASLIFSAEIIITLLTNPIMCKLLNMEYTPATLFQVMGGVLLIIATLMVDETVMSKLGYVDMQEVSYVDEYGKTVQRTSVSRKMILTTLTFALITLILSTVTFLSAIHFIRTDAVDNSQALGETASTISSQAMMNKLEESIQNQATDKALLAEQKLSAYSDSVLYAASYADALYRYPENYPDREVDRPLQINAGLWAMQRTLADESIDYEDLRTECSLLGNMVEAFAPIVANNDNIATIYMGTENGLLISYDPNSGDGNPDGESYYEYRHSTWYETARTGDRLFFTEPYQDGYGRGLTITCAAPFHDIYGNFAGCIAMDILMADLNASMVNDGIIDPSVATLIDNEGNYIAGKNVNPMSENMGNIFNKGNTDSLHQVGHEILEKKNGIVSVGGGENALYIAFATINSTDWTLCIMSPVSSVIQPAVEIRENINQNTQNVVNTVTTGIQNVIQSCLLLSALILLFVTLFTGKFSKRISDPLKQLETDVHRISDGNLESRTEVSTDDEIGSLASSFNHMADSLQQYITDLREATAREERIDAELNVARQIQVDMLPNNSKELSEGKVFDVFASMTPAKEVGGDFYDYYMLDDDHLVITVADVSGKGVGAALFMARSMTILKARMMMMRDPASALIMANNELCRNNEEMFVTVWLGILELPTGHLTFANAGHEAPLLRHNGVFSYVQQKSGFILGGMEDIKYKNQELFLRPGDLFFQYTDGVPEATNSSWEQIGKDGVLKIINSHAQMEGGELLAEMLREVQDFTGDAPQYDDVTMLALYYGGKNR